MLKKIILKENYKICNNEFIYINKLFYYLRNIFDLF